VTNVWFILTVCGIWVWSYGVRKLIMRYPIDSEMT
jgi:hypothetical protein